MAALRVQFPVPVLAVPPRSRKPRILTELRSAAIELAEVDPDAFEPVPYTPADGYGYSITRIETDERGCALYVRDGALWHRMVRFHSDQPMPRDRFEALASGRMAENRRTWLLNHFARSPLVAAGQNDFDAALIVRDKGDPDALAGARVLDDPGEAVEAGLRAYLARDVALVGDAVYVRIGAPSAIQGMPMEAPDMQMTLFPRPKARLGNFCRHDDVTAFRAIQERHGLPGTRVVGRAGELVGREGAAAVPAELLGDEDLRLLACCLAEELYLLAQRPRSPYAEIAPALARPALLARVGLVPGDDVEGALVALRGAIEAAEALVPYLPGALAPRIPGRFGFARDFIAEVALPRLAARVAPEREADAPALAALGPG